MPAVMPACEAGVEDVDFVDFHDLMLFFPALTAAARWRLMAAAVLGRAAVFDGTDANGVAFGFV